ncbi:MAG: hypothetical protein DHS20C21_09840 [Gemmatimonadota bacterium]|nr:MAG: hypothetical protein DHS20C21_09840 [Gemmatimonadota bacterium]
MKQTLTGWTALAAIVVGLGSATPALAIFDDLEYSPRAAGLGGAYAGLSDDATAVFYNPAGLAGLTDYSFHGTFFEPFNLGFHKASAAAFAMPTDNWGSFGIGYSDFRVDYLGSTLSIERTVTLSHGLVLMEDISSSLTFGYNINLYNLDYPTTSVSGLDLGSETTLGVDIGFQATVRERTTAGVFAKNVNAATMGDPVATDLPQRVSAGMAYRPYDGVVTAVEFEKELGEEIQFHGGMEFRIADPLTLRFGTQTKPNLFDIGIGIKYAQVDLDFTFTNHPVLEETFRYGVGLRF